MTAPFGSRTGAETRATPVSRSATDCAQPRRRTSASVRSVNVASAQHRALDGRVGPRRQHLGAGSGAHRQPGAERDGVAQPGQSAPPPRCRSGTARRAGRPARSRRCGPAAAAGHRPTRSPAGRARRPRAPPAAGRGASGPARRGRAVRAPRGRPPAGAPSPGAAPWPRRGRPARSAPSAPPGSTCTALSSTPMPLDFPMQRY